MSTSNYTSTINVSCGGAGYTPVMGDYDGDARADLAVCMSSTGGRYVLLSGSQYTTTIVRNWGGSTYAPLPAYPSLN